MVNRCWSVLQHVRIKRKIKSSQKQTRCNEKISGRSVLNTIIRNILHSLKFETRNCWMLLYTKIEGPGHGCPHVNVAERRKVSRIGRLASKYVEQYLWLTYGKTREREVFKIIEMERRGLSGVPFLRSLDFMSEDIVVYISQTWLGTDITWCPYKKLRFPGYSPEQSQNI